MNQCTHCGQSLPPDAPAGSLCANCSASATARGTSTISRRAGAIPPELAAQHLGPSWSLTTVLVAANVLLFALMVLKGVPFFSPHGDQLIRWGANYGPLTLGGEWWRLLANTFIHVGILHLAFNMWALWNLGQLGEMLYSRRTMLLIYLLSGIAGSLMSLGWRPGSVAAGASGAIFGLAGALLASLKLGKLPFDPGALKATTSSLVSFAGYSLLFGFITPGIDNAAHLGGLVAGLFMGGALGTFIYAPRRQRPLVLRAIFAVTAVVLLAFGAYVHKRNSFVVHVHRANIAHSKNQLDAAISEWRQVARLRANESQAWYGLGAALQRKQADSGEAEAAFRKSISLDARFAPAHVELGKVLMLRGQPEQAIVEFQQARSIQPNNIDAMVNTGLAFAQLNKHAESAKVFEDTLKAAPNIPFVRLLLAQQLAAMKEYDHAIEQVNAGLKLQPNDLPLLGALHQLYVAKGLMEEAGDVQGRIYELRRQAEEQAQKQQQSQAPQKK